MGIEMYQRVHICARMLLLLLLLPLRLMLAVPSIRAGLPHHTKRRALDSAVLADGARALGAHDHALPVRQGPPRQLQAAPWAVRIQHDQQNVVARRSEQKRGGSVGVATSEKPRGCLGPPQD